MKKGIALLLLACMLGSLLAGCAGSGTQNADDPVSSRVTGEKQTSEEDSVNPALISGGASLEGDLSEHWLCDEKTTLTVCTYDGVNSTYYPPSNDLWFWQLLEDYTNVHIEWEISPIAGYDEIINTRLSAGVDLSDIIMSNGVRATQNAGDNGVFIDLKPYWDTCFTNTQTYFDSIDVDLLTLIENPNGKVYALPNTLNPTEGHITFMYNTEWLEELGEEVPTTLEGFTNLLYKMQQAGDLNHNGVDDEIILTSSSISILMSVLGNAFNLEMYEGWDAFDVDADGVVYNEYTTENMRECLKYMNQLYRDGILDSEISYMSADDMGEKIANDRVGCFVYYSGFAVSYGALTSRGQADPMAECYTLGLPLASEWNGNEGYFVRRTVAYGNTGAAITSECENPELAAKWLDVLYADPNILWARVYGKEGETYRYNDNGEVELLATDANGEWNPFYLGIGQISLPFIQTTEELCLESRSWYLEEYEQIRNSKWISASVPKATIFTDDEAYLRDEVNSETTSYWLEWRDKFITGMADIDADWNTYVNSLNGIGMLQLTDVWQMVYDRLKAQG